MTGRDDLAFAGVVRQAELVRSGEVSARELVELHLERVGRLEPELNAFRLVMAERALADAEQADARRGAGEDRPLLGVPVAVKDVHDVAGEVTAHGTAAHGGPAPQDCELVGRLRAAGAVILGKANTPELAIMGATEGPAFGVTRNPWNSDRTPGGSSGGSACAVAAGMAAAATASDGGGSIRIPAANCGLFGLKPQRARVSLAPARELWHGLIVNGFETRSVADTALLLDVAAGPGPTGPDPPPAPPRSFAEAAATPPGRLRVAVSTRPPLPGPVDGEVKQAVQATAELLRGLGHAVGAADPDYGTAFLAASILYLRGIHEDAAAMPRPDRLQRRTRGFAGIGAAIPDTLLDRARRAAASHAARINRIFDDHDVVLMPVTATPPVGAAEWEGRGALRTIAGMSAAYPFCVTWNLTGQPAAAVPAGLTGDGLPIAIQLVGRPNDEGTLLSLSAQIEAERPWADRRPPVA